MAEIITSLLEIGDGHEDIWHAHGDSNKPKQNTIDMQVIPLGGKPQIVFSEFMGDSGTVAEGGIEESIIFQHNDTFGNSVYEPLES